MKRILEQIYNGEIYPAEQIVPHSAAYQEAVERYNQHCDDFLKQLDDRGGTLKQAFDRLLDEAAATDAFECYDHFECGFLMGAQLMLEVCTHAPIQKRI